MKTDKIWGAQASKYSPSNLLQAIRMNGDFQYPPVCVQGQNEEHVQKQSRVQSNLEES